MDGTAGVRSLAGPDVYGPSATGAAPAVDGRDADGAAPTEVRIVDVGPNVVSPAWELELLVTGIVLVGLMQVPPWLHDVWQHRLPHTTLIGAAAGGVVFFMFAAMLYALIGCFMLALALRGYWVALVGTNSVFPHGVRWDKQREYGPIQAELIRRRVRPLPTFIAGTDRAASLVFATGFVLAASSLASFAPLALLLFLFWGLTAVLPARSALLVLVATAAVVGAAIVVTGVLDMRYGRRIPADGRFARAMRAVLRLASGVAPAGVRSLGAVLTSNLDKRVAYGATLVGLGGAFVTAHVVIRGDEGLPGRSNYAFFAEHPGPGVVTADYYDTLRRDGETALGAPSIQSDIVTDPYVRLFVPYRPSRHDAALRRACPGLRPTPGDADAPGAAAADDAVLACAARLHAVTLDGRPVPGGRFRFFTNPRTERRGFLMLIPALALAPGEHVLTVHPALRDPSPADTAPIRIPFWR